MEEYIKPQKDSELNILKNKLSYSSKNKLYSPLKLISNKSKKKIPLMDYKKKIKTGSISSTNSLNSTNSFSSVNQFYNMGEDSML